MKKYTILAAMLFGVFGCVFAQDGSSTSGSGGSSASYAPEAGDISVAVLFGRGNYLSSGLRVPPSPSVNTTGSWGNNWTVPGTAPGANMIDGHNNPVINMIGAEVRYFLMPNIALKLSGGAINSSTPGVINVPGMIDPNADNSTWIPDYQAVVADKSLDANVNIGAEYHFGTKYSRLFPYAGVTVPFYYGRRTAYNPTITAGENPVIVDIGSRHVEAIGFGAQAVGGVDYYLMEGLYFGFEIKPLSYIYSYNTKFPAPGLETLQAENHTVAFFSQTFMKVGFRF